MCGKTRGTLFISAALSHGTVLIVRSDGLAGVAGGLAERAQLVRDIDGGVGSEMVPLVEVMLSRDDGRLMALIESPDNAPYPGQRVLLANGAIVRDSASAGR